MARTLVLLHGFTHTGASWAAVIDALGERYRPLAPDIRGHGRSSDVEPVDLEHVIGDIAAQDSGAFTLVGYSMGGRIALHAALELPDRIERLVLIGASPGIADHTERARRAEVDEQLANEIEQSSIEEFASSWARTPVLSDQPADVAEAVHAVRLCNTPVGLARALRGLGTGALGPVWKRLPELRPPTTLIAGERDLKFTRLASEMASLIPAAEVLIVSGAGHAVHLEKPVQVAAVITQHSRVQRRNNQ
jgi:2-succinyl-6-hydroxy-2,4-cyclohexadiene-1-carboxylate synthase